MMMELAVCASRYAHRTSGDRLFQFTEVMNGKRYHDMNKLVMDRFVARVFFPNLILMQRDCAYTRQ